MLAKGATGALDSAGRINRVVIDLPLSAGKSDGAWLGCRWRRRRRVGVIGRGNEGEGSVSCRASSGARGARPLLAKCSVRAFSMAARATLSRRRRSSARRMTEQDVVRRTPLRARRVALEGTGFGEAMLRGHDGWAGAELMCAGRCSGCVGLTGREGSNCWL